MWQFATENASHANCTTKHNSTIQIRCILRNATLKREPRNLASTRMLLPSVGRLQTFVQNGCRLTKKLGPAAGLQRSCFDAKYVVVVDGKDGLRSTRSGAARGPNSNQLHPVRHNNNVFLGEAGPELAPPSNQTVVFSAVMLGHRLPTSWSKIVSVCLQWRNMSHLTRYLVVVVFGRTCAINLLAAADACRKETSSSSSLHLSMMMVMMMCGHRKKHRCTLFRCFSLVKWPE